MLTGVIIAMLRRSALVVLTIAAALILPLRADAGFTVCNQTDDEASLAVGYHDSQQGWVAEGWWSIATGECAEMIDEPLAGDRIYIYGDGEGGSWHAGPKQKGGYFCIAEDAFETRNADVEGDDQVVSCDDGFEAVQYREVRIGRTANVTLNLTY